PVGRDGSIMSSRNVSKSEISLTLFASLLLPAVLPRPHTGFPVHNGLPLPVFPPPCLVVVHKRLRVYPVPALQAVGPDFINRWGREPLAVLSIICYIIWVIRWYRFALSVTSICRFVHFHLPFWQNGFALFGKCIPQGPIICQL